MSDNLNIFGQTYTGVTGIKAKDTNNVTQTYIKPTGTLSINTNGTKDVTNYASVNVAVPTGSTINNQNKTVTPTASTQTIEADVDANNYTGLGIVTVNPIPSQYIIPTGTYTVDENGNYDITQYASIEVDVDTVNNQNKTATPTETRQYITPDTDYTGLEQVIIEPIANDYIGSAIDRRTSTDLSVSGATVTAPAGYYASAASASVATATQATPSLSVNSSGLVTATATQTAGYVAAGSKSSTLQLTTQAATTVAPNTTEQTIVTAGKYTTGAIKVSAIPTQTKTAVSNGTILPDTGYYLTEVEVDVPSDINNQSKTVTPTELEQQITADSGYSGLSDVTVEAISPSYVGSGITRRSNSDLSASGATVSVPSGYYASNASKSVATTTVATPSISIDNNGKISSSVAQTAGYVAADTKTNNLQMTTIAATTITPSSSSQTAVAKNVYTLGAITVAAVPTETKTVTSNGTVTPSAGKFLSSVVVNVPIGSTINNQNKTVTPTKSQQSVTFDVDSNNYTGLGTVTVNAIPSQYITTSDADAVAANLLYNKTAYVNGSKITGTMANNGATGGTITSQGGTYTIPAGYTSGGTVTANLTASSLTNTIINGTAALEDTNDYSFDVEVNIPAGYHNATTLTKSFSSILPAPTTEGTAPELLAGYDLYNHLGQVITGSMTNNGAWNRTLDQTTTSVTIPAGYHDGTGTVSHTTVNIPDPTITVSSGGLITASGSWTRGFTTDNSYSKTQQLTTQAAKTVTPTESEQNAVAAGVYTTGIVKVGAISSTYVGSGVTKKAAATITPGTTNQTIASGTYLTGTQTIAGDADLVAGNIKSGVQIFGVTGSYSGLDTSDATATAADIIDGETAYVDGRKIEGTLIIQRYYTGSTVPSSSLGANGDIYLQS